MFFVILLLLLNAFASSERAVEIERIYSYLQVLALQNELSANTATMMFSNLEAMAVPSLQAHTVNVCDLDVTVNGKVHTIVISEGNSHVERTAARFCIAHGIPARTCATVRDELLRVANAASLDVDTTPQEANTIPALLLSPSATSVQFTEQRVYFNVSLQFPLAFNDSNMCYHVDFDSNSILCGPASTLVSELAYSPRPSYTQPSFDRGWHSVSVRPDLLSYSSDFRFFFVAEPSINIVSASIQYLKQEQSSVSVTVSARVQVSDFRLGVDGTYCMLLDWQVVTCSDHSDALMHATEVRVPTELEAPDSMVSFDIQTTIASHRPNNQVQALSFVLLSAVHHSKAVAVSNSFLLADATPTTRRETNVYKVRPDLALLHLQQSEWGKWSQNGEDGLLLWIFSELGMLEYTIGGMGQSEPRVPRFFVEFGVEDGYECNTRFLREEFGWKGLLMDGSHTNASLNLRQEFITAEDINTLFDTYHVPTSIDFLSIDIDYNDFWVLKSILEQGKYSAKVIAIEYNSHVPANESRTIAYNATGGWDGFSDYSGASAAAMAKLGAEHGYRLIYCESHGVNAFLVHEDLIAGDGGGIIPVREIQREPNFFGKGLSYPHGNGTWVTV